MSLTYWILCWLAVLVLAVIFELVSAAFVSIWFVVGALVIMTIDFILYFISKDISFVWYYQSLIFLIVSLVSLLLFRPVMVAKMIKKPMKTNSDSNIGLELVLLSNIKENSVSSIKVKGKEWSCVTSDGKALEKGTKVVIKAIEGVKLVIEKIEN